MLENVVKIDIYKEKKCRLWKFNTQKYAFFDVIYIFNLF